MTISEFKIYFPLLRSLVLDREFLSFIFSQIMPLSGKDKPVSCVCFCVPLPFLSQLCWCPGFSPWLAERGCGHTVWPDDPEPAVLGGDSRAPLRSRLPAVPPASAHPAAKLRHRFHGSAASHGELLWLPASPPTPCLTTGIRASASTNTGECASSHTWDPELVDPEHLELGFHVEYRQLFPPRASGAYWYCQPTGPGLSCPPAVQSLMRLRKEVGWSGPASPGPEGMAHCLGCWCRGHGRASPPAGWDSLRWWLRAGKPWGRKRGSQLLGALHLSCCCSGDIFPFLSIHKHLSGANRGLLSEHKGGS